jgi:uncharacterized protein
MTPFNWHDETFILHPSRAMFWEREKILILSDLHLGKTGHFRKEGIAVPQQVYQNDLNRLFSTIQFFNPEEILMVGDLFHSKANREWDWFAKWRTDFGHIKFSLVLGNHDKLPHGIAESMQLAVYDMLQKKHLMFVHNAMDADVTKASGFTGMVCGHVHPSVQMATGVRQKIRLPCFHFTPNTCTLPAFSLFTGAHTIKPKGADIVFAITENEIIQL